MKKILLFVLISFISVSILLADTTGIRTDKGFSLGVDFAYYPKSDAISGLDHFAPITGALSGLEFRVVPGFTYTIFTPFSDNPFVSGNNLKIKTTLEVSPVSLSSTLSVSFTPVAFLIFSTGANIGSGWSFAPMNVDGMAAFDSLSNSYEALSPFSSLYSSVWFEGLFQFDLAAVLPGEWNHVALVATYKPYYEALSTGGEDGNPWLWQGSGEKVNGWQYYSNIILAYQMPLLLQTIGIQTEFHSYYSENSFAAQYTRWNPCFTKISINPLVNLRFAPNHNLIIQAGFSSRRSFTQASSTLDHDLLKTYEGREWYFNRLAVSYSFTF